MDEPNYIQEHLTAQAKRTGMQFIRPFAIGLTFFALTCVALAYFVGPTFWSGLPFGIGISVLLALAMAVLRLQELSIFINQIIYEKENLAYKIVGQQEEIQKRISRDIHDAVIGDILAIKRSLTSDRPLSHKEVSEDLDKIMSRLREICHDLSPRDLRDWGLQTVVEDLLERVSQRSNIDCVHNCDIEIPELDSSVQLHIFRIIQECLNNIEKHSTATSGSVSTTLANSWLYVTVADNGKGFEYTPNNLEKYGSGINSILERTELIKSIYPAEISIQSNNGQGTKVQLRIKMDGK